MLLHTTLLSQINLPCKFLEMWPERKKYTPVALVVLLTLFSCGISFALNVYSARILMNDVSGLMSMRWLKPCLSARDTRLTLRPRHGHGAYLAPAQWRLQQDARSQRGRTD